MSNQTNGPSHRTAIRTELQAAIARLDRSFLPGDVDREVERLLRALLSFRPKPASTARGRTSYDRLLYELLTSIKADPSRDQFLGSVIRSVMREEPISPALAMFVLEQETSGSGGVEFIHWAARNEQRFTNVVASVLRRLPKGPLARHCLSRQLPIDFVLTSDPPQDLYGGELDGLIDDQDAWLCVVPLEEADQRLPRRALVVLYPVHLSTIDSFGLPPGATQEWQVLKFVPDVYFLLGKQQQLLAKRTEDERDRILAQFGASMVAHEIKNSLTPLKTRLNELAGVARRLARRQTEGSGRDPDVFELEHQVQAIGKVLSGAIGKFTELTNLERREEAVAFDLDRIIHELLDLLDSDFRKAKIRTHLDVPAIRMTSYPSLIQQIILNVLLNAQAALAGQKTVRNIWIRARVIDGEVVEILIANNGPEIPLEKRLAIFDRGVTNSVRGAGHGMGLFISRRLAQVMKGQFGLGRMMIKDKPANACFRLMLPLKSDSLDSQTRKSTLSVAR